MCLSAKQIMPAISIMNALTIVKKVPVDPDNVPAAAVLDPKVPVPLVMAVKPPRLKMSSKAPKIRPLIPASESIRFVASEKQCSAPSEQIRLMTITTIDVAERLVGRLRG